ncbi:MAG TPA: acyltransferase [Bacteroidia bacterium]|jgi:peptidoglycan/LPS O-acetylase OafA/YrhL|nr:acyltransferase [Bacteroidia bacterium]
MGIIRFLLAISVVVHHSGPLFGCYFVGGSVAVQSFFVISGFYMSLILNEKYIGINSSYKLFITNRLIKLYPIYWTILLGTLLACLAKCIISHGQDMAIFGNYFSVKFNFFSFAYLILTNLLIFGQDVVTFLGINPENGHLFFTTDYMKTNPILLFFLFVPQAWSLGCELVFYLIAPLIFKKGIKIVWFLILISFFLRIYIHNHLGLNVDSWTSRFFPTEIMFFLLGYISYRLYLVVRKKNISVLTNRIVLIGMVLFIFLYWNIPHVGIPYFPFHLKLTIYYICFVIAIPILFNFLKNDKWDNKIGELSYPIYISHLLIIMISTALSFSVLKSSWCILLITILISYFLNKFIASPIEKYRQARLKATTAN